MIFAGEIAGRSKNSAPLFTGGRAVFGDDLDDALVDDFDEESSSAVPNGRTPDICGGLTTWDWPIAESTNTDDSSTEIVATPAEIAEYFDANGNQKKLDHLAGVTWTYRDSISSATIIERDDPTPDDVEYYVYDAAGQRVRKVKETWGSGVVTIEEKIYLGGVEVKRKRQVGQPNTLERWSLHVMDDKQRIALAHRWTNDATGTEAGSIVDPAVPASYVTKLRYQYGNHLGSASLELDSAGLIVSYEEYFPYGETSFMFGPNQIDVKLKEYRYTGKERDDSTSLYYYGQRYYAPWLCRWMSADPAGPVDGVNLYVYVGGNPVKFVDPNGSNKLLSWLQRKLELTSKIVEAGVDYLEKERQKDPGDPDKDTKLRLTGLVLKLGAKSTSAVAKAVGVANAIADAGEALIGPAVPWKKEEHKEAVENTKHNIAAGIIELKDAAKSSIKKVGEAAHYLTTESPENITEDVVASGAKQLAKSAVFADKALVEGRIQENSEITSGLAIVGLSAALGKVAEIAEGGATTSRVLDAVNILENPRSLWGKSAAEIAEEFKEKGFIATVRQSTRGSGKAQIIEIEGHPSVTQIQVHPGGGRHGGTYIKISTSTEGVVKIVDPATYKAMPGEKARIVRMGE